MQLFKAVQDNKPFIMNVYHSVSREQVENYLYKVTYDLLEGVVEEQAQGMSVRQEDNAHERGLSAEILSKCEKTIKIPMSPRCESLNAAVAASVVLWEMYR